MTEIQQTKGLILEVSHTNKLIITDRNGEKLIIELVLRPGRALRAKLNFKGDREVFKIDKVKRELTEYQKKAVANRSGRTGP